MTSPSPVIYYGGTLNTFYLYWYNEENGVLTDPIAVQLDITLGGELGEAPDVAGPFYYSGASGPTTGQIYRISQGVYAYAWPTPYSIYTGVYVMNWSVTAGSPSDVYLVTENNYVQGISQTVPSVDVGYWTGSLAYTPPNTSQPIQINLGQVDSNGTGWILQQVVGWDGAPAVGQVIQRSADQGGWAASQFYGPRLITLTVTASAQSQPLRDVARGQMAQVVPINDLAVFTYNEPVPKFAQVRLNAGAQIVETYMTTCDVTFSVPLVAPDPRKYGVTPMSIGMTLPTTIPTPLTLPLTTPFTLAATVPPGLGSMSCVNYGNYETRPILTVNGPIPAPIITNMNTGQSISYSQATLGPTDQLVISTDARIGYLNGAFIPSDVWSAWWTLWPGVTSLQLQNGTGNAGTVDVNAQLKANWYSAYM
jgi:Phage tail protein